jgi:hypothetical protein
LDARTEARTVATRAGWICAGGAIGFVPFLLLSFSARAVQGETTFTTNALARNFRLLTDECLPWVLSTTAYTPESALGYVRWHSGTLFRLVQAAGGLTLMAGAAFALVASRMTRIPWPVRRLGVFGFVLIPTTLGAFLVSVMVMDLFSARYLVAVVLASPFALAPAAYRLGLRRFGATLAPYVVSAAVAGWLGFGAKVANPAPVHLPGSGALDETRLERALLEKGVTSAVADYWVSYRLTFLYREALEVIPVHAAEDRYPAYRRTFARAARVAYVFDANRSRETFASMLDEVMLQEGIAAPTATLREGDLTAVILDRPPKS